MNRNSLRIAVLLSTLMILPYLSSSAKPSTANENGWLWGYLVVDSHAKESHKTFKHVSQIFRYCSREVDLNGNRNSMKAACEYEMFKEVSTDCGKDYVIESYYGAGGSTEEDAKKMRANEFKGFSGGRQRKEVYLSCASSMYSTKCK